MRKSRAEAARTRGALTLARAVNDVGVSDEILVSVRKTLLADELRRNEGMKSQGNRLTGK